MDEPYASEITARLAAIGRGNEAATRALLDELYQELRALAGSFFRRELPGQTLQPTALVHEAFLKLTRGATPDWESRAHFLAVAARAMRQILANHAESRRAAKRGGGALRVTLTGLATDSDAPPGIDLIDLDEALGRLARLSPEQARIVELRFLAGIEEREVAHLLGMSERSVRRKWRMARAFLEGELRGAAGP